MSGPGAAVVPESMAWGTSPALYLSYGMASLRGRRPALTDSVAAAPSFTALSPPLGLDYFAVFDGAAAAAERLRAAIAEVVEGELRSEKPRFGEASRDVERWWRAVIRDAFWRAVGSAAVASGTGGGGGVGTAASVALVLEKHIVLANCGACKTVLSRGGEHVELTPEHMVNKQSFLLLSLSLHSTPLACSCSVLVGPMMQSVRLLCDSAEQLKNGQITEQS